MQIDDKLIDYLEELSRLALSGEEKQKISSDLKKILQYMDCLGQLDTNGVLGRSHPYNDVNTFREDNAGASFDRDLILKNAPDRKDGMFVAPKIRADGVD